MLFPVLTKRSCLTSVLFLISAFFLHSYLILYTQLLCTYICQPKISKSLFLIKQGDDQKTLLGVLVMPSLLDQWSPEWGVQGNPLGCEWAVSK